MASNESQNQPATRVSATTFSLRSIMVIMTVAAATAVSLAHLFRAASGELSEIGPFVVVTAVSPLLLMIVVSWTFKILDWFNKTL